MHILMKRFLLLMLCLWLAACHDASDPPDNQAAEAAVRVTTQEPGITPFIATLSLGMRDFTNLAEIAYTIDPKPGSFSKPVSVSYTREWLERKHAWDEPGKRLAVTVFGLYANYANTVTLAASFRDGSVHRERVVVATLPYAGAAAVYNTPEVKTARSASVDPGIDYLMIKNTISTPVVLDSDGNLRWVGGPEITNSASSVFDGDSFIVGSALTPELFRVGLDGRLVRTPLVSTRYTSFHHDLAWGKTGLLAELDAIENGIRRIESELADVTPAGQVLKEWDLAAIFRKTMRDAGDNPDNFVRDGIDWFHMNSAIYVPSDDSLLVSSRENFVVKLDYATGAIKWIFGDTTKHWYVDYPSLRALALTLTSGNPPIGQHSLSIASNGDLLLFNNGLGSANQPPGTSPGVTRSVSFPSRYKIDEPRRTAAEVWSYSPTPPVLSDVCSSVYETSAGGHIITYSVAAGRTRTKLVAIDSHGQVAFDYEYPTTPCAVAFISQPIGFAGLSLK